MSARDDDDFGVYLANTASEGEASVPSRLQALNPHGCRLEGGERDRGVVDVWATTKLRRDLKQKHIAICLRIIFGVEFVYRMMLTHTRIYVLARYQQRERQTEAGEHTFVSVCCAGVQVMRDGCEVWGGEGDIRCGMRSVSRW